MTIKDRVTELCRLRGVSVPELERKIGLGKSAVNKWSTSMPNTEKLVKVADYFDVSVDFLLGREKPLPPADNFTADLSNASESEKNAILAFLEYLRSNERSHI